MSKDHDIDDDDDDFGHARHPIAPRTAGRVVEELHEELVFLRRRVRELERQLAPFATRQRDPHDVDGDEDLECPNKGRYIR